MKYSNIFFNIMNTFKKDYRLLAFSILFGLLTICYWFYSWEITRYGALEFISFLMLPVFFIIFIVNFIFSIFFFFKNVALNWMKSLSPLLINILIIIIFISVPIKEFYVVYNHNKYHNDRMEVLKLINNKTLIGSSTIRGLSVIKPPAKFIKISQNNELYVSKLGAVFFPVFFYIQGVVYLPKEGVPLDKQFDCGDNSSVLKLETNWYWLTCD